MHIVLYLSKQPCQNLSECATAGAKQSLKSAVSSVWSLLRGSCTQACTPQVGWCRCPTAQPRLGAAQLSREGPCSVPRAAESKLTQAGAAGICGTSSLAGVKLKARHHQSHMGSNHNGFNLFALPLMPTLTEQSQDQADQEVERCNYGAPAGCMWGSTCIIWTNMATVT